MTQVLPLVALLSLSAVAQADIRIDQEEWRTEPARHLFLRGDLDGQTGFVVLLPDPSVWQSRLMHFLGGGMGGVADAGLKNGASRFALHYGAIYVESSQGHTGGSYLGGFTAADVAYEASRKVVEYARDRARRLYGKLPAYSYVFGGSGGGFRSAGMLERFPQFYDGAVPTLGAGPIEAAYRTHSLYEDARPVLEPLVEALDDLERPGSTGRLDDVLKIPAQRAAWKDLLAGGFPRHSILFLHPNPAGVSLREFMQLKSDPAYFGEYWKTCRDCRAAIVEGVAGTVESSEPKAYRLLADLDRPDQELFGYTLAFTSGALRGQSFTVMSNHSRSLTLSPHRAAIDGVRPGDRFTLDNRDLLAWRALHRVELPPDGSGKIQGKMISMFGADDFNVWPSIGVRYDRAVRRALGAGADDHFRIHFFEHGVHGGVLPNAAGRQVADGLVTYKALADLMAWVEKGVAPPAGTRYSVDREGQLALPKSAAERGGYQPVVGLTADGRSERLEIEPGAEVLFRAEAEDPDNEILRAEMDFDGGNRFEQAEAVRGKKIALQFRHRYEKPGVYFATVRVTDSTDVPGSPGKGLQNLATLRIVVRYAESR